MQSVSSWFYKETEVKIQPKKKIDVFCSFVTDFEKTDLSIDLIANAFQGSIKDYFRYFLHLFSVPSFISPKKQKGAYSCLPSKDSLNYSLSLFKEWFHFWSFYSVQNASGSFTCI